MPQGQDLNGLMQLLQKYGGVSKVPVAMLASVGYTPQSAQAAVNAMASTTQTGGPISQTGIVGDILRKAQQQALNPAPSVPISDLLGTAVSAATGIWPNKAAQIGLTEAGTAFGGSIFGAGAGMPFDPSSEASGNGTQPSWGKEITPFNPSYANAADQRAQGAHRGYGGGSVESGPPANPNDAQRGGIADIVAPNWSDYVNSEGQLPYVDIPAPPDPYQFVSHDFTDQATGMAAKAYSPAFAAIELGKQQAQKDYNYASAVTKGLYSDLGTQIAANNAALDKSYTDAQAAATQNTTDANQALSDAYTGSATGVADVLKGLGLGDTAATVLAPSVNQEGFQKGQNIARGQTQQNALTADKGAADTYGTGMANAAATQGTVAQQDLLQGLGQQNTQYEQQRLGLSSDEANRIIDIAQQLTSNDMNLQQMNYGSQQDYYNALVNRATAQNSNITNQNQLAAQMGQGAYNAAENQYEYMTSQQLEQAKLDLQAQIEHDQVTNNNAQLGVDMAKLAQAAQAAQAKIQNQGNPVGTLNTTISNIITDATGTAPTPQVVAGYSQAIQDFALTFNNGTKPTSANDFINAAMQMATQKGMDPNVMRSAAWAMMASGMLAGFNNSQGSVFGAANLPTAGG